MILRRYTALILGLLLTFSTVGQNLEKDRKAGEEGFEMVKSQMGFYEFEPLETLISKVGNKLVAQLDNPLFTYEFYLVDSPEPNAFALPGGKIFVTRGLLALPLTEGELAGVIGHEIIHANNRHGIKQQHGSIFGTIISIPGVIIGGIFRGPIGTAIASPFLLGNELLQADYSRGHEREADKQGTELAAKAGYDPYDLARILSRLSSETELLTGQLEKQSYFASHPFTPKRVKAITKHSEKYVQEKPSPIVEPALFLKKFDGLMIGQNPEYGFIKEGIFYHPNYHFSIELNCEWQSAITPASFSLGSNDGDAILSFVVQEDSLNQATYLDEFQKQMLNETGSEPNRKEEFDWYGYKGGMVEYTSESNGEPVKFQIYAVDYKDGTVFKIAALFKSVSQKKVENLLSNAKVLKASEIPNTAVPTLQIKKAMQNETFKSLLDRTGSGEFDLLLKVINEKSDQHILNEGELVKIITNKTYKF